MRSLFAAMRKGRKRKRGASLAMVLVSMTVLTIMGTLFTTIAMRSYQYSYSRLCRQQAYYTASSSVESFYNYVSSNPNVLSVMITQLNDACEGKVSADEGAQTYATIDPTTVRLKVGSTGGGAMTGDTVSLVPNGFFDLYLGSCTLWVRFNNTDRTEISVEAEATYNGYSETVRAIIARTNGAASELKKIFDNTFCLQSPITTIVADSTYGDVYVSQPVASTIENPQNDVEKDYNTVLKSLLQNGSYTPQGQSPVAGTPGQYLRNANGAIYTADVMGNYNIYLRDNVYGKAQASTADGSLMGHTKPIDFDNTPMDSGFYNDWVELYMFSANDGGTIVDGNLYADSKILIGLVDRDQNNRDYIRIWDNDLKRAVYPGVAYNYNGTDSNKSWRYTGYDAYFKDGNLDPNFEHGFGKDVFFDHQGSEVLERSRSKFRINGDMYLWEDARIENFDSTKTENKEKGIKNNIYAAKNLYIDGLYISDWQRSDNIVYEQMKFVREVDIYGDVIVYGDAYISGTNIEGNVYCFGEELIMTETNVKGNVYFCGSSFTGDHLYVDGNVVIADDDLNDLANKDYNYGVGTFGAAGDVGGTASKYRWGAVFQNCDVLGTLWSNVNTHIVVGKSERNMLTFDGDPYASIHGNNSDVYGNIIVDAYLFIDLAQGLDVTGRTHVFFPYKSNYLGNVDDKYHELAERNGITYDGSYVGKDQVIYAERLQIRLNQSDAGSKGRRSFFGDIYVGDGNFFIDGNASDGDRNDAPGGQWYNGLSVYIAGLYSKSQGKIYDTTISGRITNEMVKEWWEVNGDPWYEEYGFNYNNRDVAAGERIQDNVDGEELDGALIDRVVQGTISDHFKFKLGDVESAATAARNNFTDPLWKEKLIKIRTWSAPVAGDKTEFNLVEGLIVKYVGEDVPDEGVGGGNTLFGNPTTTTVANYIATYSDAFEVTDNGNTLIISDSVTFNCFADFSAYKRVIFDTSEGNIYVKFLYGAEFGKAQTDTSSPTSSEVVLTGGNMVFWYLYQEGNYDVDHPTLAVNPYTNVGIVTASSGAGRGNDGLYIVSNDDALITFGQNAVLNGYLYAPHGHIFFAPSAEHATFTVLNGCMAIESLVMLTTADQSSQSWWDEFWNNLWGGWDSTDIIDSVIEQYGDLVFNYVQPPLITDSVLMGGLTDQEVTDFNSVVWEFLGYY